MLYTPPPEIKQAFADLCKRESFTVPDVEGLFLKPKTMREREEVYYRCLCLVRQEMKAGRLRFKRNELRFERT